MASPYGNISTDMGTAVLAGREAALARKKKRDTEEAAKRTGLAAFDALGLQKAMTEFQAGQDASLARADQHVLAQDTARAAGAIGGAAETPAGAAATGGVVSGGAEPPKAQVAEKGKGGGGAAFGAFTKHTKIGDQETMKRTTAEEYGGGTAAFSSKKLKHKRRAYSNKAGLSAVKGY